MTACFVGYCNNNNDQEARLLLALRAGGTLTLINPGEVGIVQSLVCKISQHTTFIPLSDVVRCTDNNIYYENKIMYFKR